MNPIVTKCPVCSGKLVVTRLECDSCDSAVEGRFVVSTPFSALSKEQADFVLTFIASRGSIKEVEKRLGISYPTVRSRLDGAIDALGLGGAAPEKERLGDMLDLLRAGEIDVDEAVRRLKGRD